LCSIAYVLSSSSNGTEVDNIRLFAANDKPDVRNNIPNKISSAPAEDIFLAKSNLELQAEFLRLEAEREQLLITQNRIIEEKVISRIFIYLREVTFYSKLILRLSETFG